MSLLSVSSILVDTERVEASCLPISPNPRRPPSLRRYPTPKDHRGHSPCPRATVSQSPSHHAHKQRRNDKVLTTQCSPASELSYLIFKRRQTRY